jgi:hypothetical protein
MATGTKFINVKIDSTELLLSMRNGHKRLSYAVVNAINKTAELIQKTEREQVVERFTVRNRTFIEREAAIIKPFASVGKNIPFAEISVGGAASNKPRLLLSAFERGAQRKPITKGAKSVAIPVVGGPARPTFGSQVPTELQVGKLKFQRTKRGKFRIGVTRTNTYLIRGVGIFQRVKKREKGKTDKESGATKLVHYFAKKPKPLRPILGFMKTAKRIANRWFPEYMRQQVQMTLKRHGNR